LEDRFENVDSASEQGLCTSTGDSAETRRAGSRRARSGAGAFLLAKIWFPSLGAV